MKAKKDGKLNASPDPYGVEDIAATKLGNIPEYMDNRQMPSLGIEEYQTYQSSAVTHMGQVGHMANNYMMSPYGSTVPKI